MVLLGTLSTPERIFADVFGPGSCDELSSTDLVTELRNSIEHRIEGLSADDTTKKLFTTRGTDVNPWTRNASVWTAQGTSSLDMTGVSPWNSQSGYTKGGTLITPRHIVLAKHYPITTGSTIVFVGNDNSIVTRTLEDQVSVVFQSPLDDVQLGVLDADVPTSTIAFYPILSKTQVEQYASSLDDMSIMIMDQEDKALVEDVDYSFYTFFEHISLYHFAPPGTSTRFAFSEELVGGDSGKPGFWVIAGQPVLALTTTGANDGPFYGTYINSINNAIIALGNDGGYRVSTYDVSCFQGNEAPVIGDQSLSLPENSIEGFEVGTATATDPYGGTTLSYSITAGNTGSAFSISTTTGVITVNVVSAIDYETNSSFTLTVVVTDSWPYPDTDTGTFTITVTDVAEPPLATTSAASSVTMTSATLNGSLTVDGISTSTARGFIYGTTNAYGATTTESGTFSTGVFSADLSGLACGTTYHFNAFATNAEGTSYGSDTTLMTGACEEEVGGGGGGGGGGGRKKDTPVITAPTGQAELLTLLRVLIAQFIALGGTPTPAMTLFLNTPTVETSYARDLTLGSAGADVTQLQQFLITQNRGPAAHTLTLTGATGYFGSQTQAALAEFQAAVGITPAVGYFGPQTRNVIAGL